MSENSPLPSENEACIVLSQQLKVPMATLCLILRLFYDEYKTLTPVTTQLIENENWPELQAYFHKLKGASGGLNMWPLRAELVILEIQLQQGQALTIEAMQPLYKEMQGVIKRYQLSSIATTSSAS